MIGRRHDLVAGLNISRQGEGEPLVLLHGIGGELCVWEPVLGALAEDFDVIAVDLPGFGRSPALGDDVVPTAAALAQAVVGLLDELEIGRAHVAGNSLGGWIALEVGRLGRALSVTGLAPAGLWGARVGGGATPVKGRAHHALRRIRPLIPVLMAPPFVRRAALGFFVAHPDRVPYHAAWRMVSSYARASAYDATRNAMVSSAFEDPEEIAVPITLAFGERDRMIRPVRLPTAGARSITLPDCGHIPMWDDPQLVVETIRGTARRARTTAQGLSPTR